MKEEFFNSIKVLSYFLWEYTKYDNVLSLWCCAEDIVCFLSENDIRTKENFINIISKDKDDVGYKEFMIIQKIKIGLLLKNLSEIMNVLKLV